MSLHCPDCGQPMSRQRVTVLQTPDYDTDEPFTVMFSTSFGMSNYVANGKSEEEWYCSACPHSEWREIQEEQP